MIQNENSRVQHVKLRFAREFNIKVIDDWLTGCVSFCLEENPGTSNEDLFQFAFSQWLLADLNEIGVSMLPPGFNGKTEKQVLNGTFPVQLHQLIDIAESAYDQWRNMHDKKLDEADDEVQMRKSQATHTKKRRMLKLTLTDGKQTFCAVEHNPIKCLTTKLAPGVKLLLTGPLRSVNSVVFLEPKNVRVLGGELDVLLISNAYENVLLRAMNKAITQNPKIDYEEADVVENRGRPNSHSHIKPITMGSRSVQGEGKVHRKSPRVAVDDEDDDSLLLAVDLDSIEGSQPRSSVGGGSKPEQVPAISTLMDDDEMEQLVHLIEDPCEPEIMNHQVSSTRHSQSSPVQSKPSLKPPPRPVEPDEEDIDMMNMLEDQIQNELRDFQPPPFLEEPEELELPQAKKTRLVSDYPAPPVSEVPRETANNTATLWEAREAEENSATISTPSQASKKFNDFSASCVFEDSLDCLELHDAPETSTPPTSILSPAYPFRIEGTSLSTIEQIVALTESERAGASFVVYGEVSDVIERPRIRQQVWHLGLMLTDHSLPMLSVQLHTTVTQSLVRTEHDPGALMRMNRTDREGALQFLGTILAELNEVLQEIKCFWLVVYPRPGASASDLPTVTETYRMNDERGAVLRDKIVKENCSQLRQML
ncbi:recQ-mediated genome instability protein 1-like [Anopheles bellator]|uniref:recQ-mediated genome instability protein 1-like n=1 Tax=Anopheles bellator TaxID=139047 RepID=UPI0026484769|nr:recQ-mediated genome instability protein 1-like [Anopheles bellator]